MKQVVPTFTEYSTTSGISILTYYSEGGVGTPIALRWQETDTILNNVTINAGDGVFIKDSSYNCIVYVNENGELIIISEDVDNYSIDEDGNIIYTIV